MTSLKTDKIRSVKIVINFVFNDRLSLIALMTFAFPVISANGTDLNRYLILMIGYITESSSANKSGAVPEWGRRGRPPPHLCFDDQQKSVNFLVTLRCLSQWIFCP